MYSRLLRPPPFVYTEEDPKPYLESYAKMYLEENALLASGGYPWAVIRLERRREYMTALEDASVKGRISRFARFIKDELKYSSV